MQKPLFRDPDSEEDGKPYLSKEDSKGYDGSFASPEGVGSDVGGKPRFNNLDNDNEYIPHEGRHLGGAVSRTR